MQLPSIVPASVALLVALGDVRRGDGQLGGDFVQRRLAAGQAELILEQGGLGRVAVGIGEVQALHRINQLLGSRLCLLHKIRDGEHRVGWTKVSL